MFAGFHFLNRSRAGNPRAGTIETAVFRKRTRGNIAAKAVKSRGNNLGDSANVAGSVSQARYCLYRRYSIAG